MNNELILITMTSICLGTTSKRILNFGVEAFEENYLCPLSSVPEELTPIERNCGLLRPKVNKHEQGGSIFSFRPTHRCATVQCRSGFQKVVQTKFIALSLPPKKFAQCELFNVKKLLIFQGRKFKNFKIKLQFFQKCKNSNNIQAGFEFVLTLCYANFYFLDFVDQENTVAINCN